MKKFITILLALIMCVSIALVATACGSSSSSDTDNDTEVKTTTTSEVWQEKLNFSAVTNAKISVSAVSSDFSQTISIELDGTKVRTVQENSDNGFEEIIINTVGEGYDYYSRKVKTDKFTKTATDANDLQVAYLMSQLQVFANFATHVKDNFASATYNEENKTYSLFFESATVSEQDVTSLNYSIKFEDDKISDIKVTFSSQTPDGTYAYNLDFDLGTAVVTIPSADQIKTDDNSGNNPSDNPGDNPGSNPGDNSGDNSGTETLADKIEAFISTLSSNPTKFELVLNVEVDMSLLPPPYNMGVVTMLNTITYSEGKLVRSSFTKDAEGNDLDEPYDEYIVDGISYYYNENDEIWRPSNYSVEDDNVKLAGKVDYYLDDYKISDTGIKSLLENATVSNDTASVTLKTGVTAPLTITDGGILISDIDVDMVNIYEVFAGLTGNATMEIKEVGTASVDLPTELDSYVQSIEEYIPFIKMESYLYGSTGKISVKEIKTDDTPVEYEILMNDGEAESKHPVNPYIVKAVRSYQNIRYELDGSFIYSDDNYTGKLALGDYNADYIRFYNIDYVTGIISKGWFDVDDNNRNKLVLSEDLSIYGIEDLTIELLSDGTVKAVIDYTTFYTGEVGLNGVEMVFDFSVTPTLNIPTAVQNASAFIIGDLLYDKIAEDQVRLAFIFYPETGSSSSIHVKVPETVTIGGTNYTVTAISNYLHTADYLYVPTTVTDFGGASANGSGGIFYMGTFEEIKEVANNSSVVYESGEPGEYTLAENVYVYSENEPTFVSGVNYWHWNGDQTQPEVWQAS